MEPYETAENAAPERLGPTPARMIIAFIAFVAATVALVLAFVGAPSALKKAADIAAESSGGSGSKGDPASLFYDVLGQGPELPAGAESSGKAEPRSSYTLELKVTSNRSEAEAAIAYYQKMGFEAYYTPLTRQGKVVYRVRRGIFSSQREATREALNLKESNVAAKVVKLQ